MKCPDCEREMNHHAEKIDYSASLDSQVTDNDIGGTLEEFHTCPSCGKTHSQVAR